jgi:hypothetical protein
MIPSVDFIVSLFVPDSFFFLERAGGLHIFYILERKKRDKTQVHREPFYRAKAS